MPKEWVRCRFGSVQFNLPPKLAENVVASPNHAPLRVFRDGPMKVIVSLPEGTATMEKDYEALTQMPPQGRGMSRPRLRLAWCRTSSADFRWTMSQDEVRWHAWCVVMNNLAQIVPDGWAETTFGDELDGILLIRQDRHFACFDWQSNAKAVGGFIHFMDDSGELDPVLLRCVCKSVQVCDEPHSGEPPAQIRAEGPAAHSAKGAALD